MTFLLSLLLATTITTKADVRRIEPAELRALMDKGEAIAIDVRGSVPFEVSHIAGAVWMPLGQLNQRAGELAEEKLIVAYCTCKSEETSLDAAMRLSELGFANVAVLQGGFPAWTAAGFSTESNREPVATPAASRGRLAPPAAVRCNRNELTSYTGKVSKYRRKSSKTTLVIQTSAGTVESITITDPIRSYLVNGTPFTAADWNRIELRKGALRPGMSAIAWVCSGGKTVVDWRPGVTFTGAE